jgi:putative serine protease PepD
VVPSVVSVAARSNGHLSEGSGVVIRSDGLVVTNNHVVADVGVNGGSVRITLASGRSAEASIVGRLPEADIAVLQAVGLRKVPVARLGSSATLRVGDPVIAVGNPLGEANTVTAGIVSALRRPACVTTPQQLDSVDQIFGNRPALPRVVRLHGLIQTDAAINPGSSGGALADAAGRVVGITTLNLSATDSGGSAGIGFAIPIELAYEDVQRLLAQAGFGELPR